MLEGFCCDGCGDTPVTLWKRSDDDAELTYCDWCTTAKREELRRARFVLRADTRP